MTEMFLGTTRGLGQLIYNAHLMYDIPLMYAGIIFAGLLGYVLNLALLILQRYWAHWEGASRP
jgi:NitT/TauT family transport system permease protein